jgi:hypothetical protein
MQPHRKSFLARVWNAVPDESDGIFKSFEMKIAAISRAENNRDGKEFQGIHSL